MVDNLVDKDLGWNKLKEFFKKTAQGRFVSVGIQGDEAEVAKGENQTNVEIAAIHEFGAPNANIPERSFLRSTFDEQLNKYKGEVDKLGGKDFESGSLDMELLLIGEELRGDIIDKLNTSIPPELAESTKANRVAKQGDAAELTTLIETGQLKNSISATVVNRSERS